MRHSDNGAGPRTFSVRNPSFDVSPAADGSWRARSARTSAAAGIDLALMLMVMIVVTILQWDVGHLWSSDALRLGLFVSLIVVYVIGADGLYARVQARRAPAAVTVVARAVGVGVGTFSLIAFFVAIGDGARRWVVAVAICWFVVLSVHHGVRAWRPRSAASGTRVIVAGSPRAAVSMRTALRADRGHSYDVVGFVVDRLTDDIPPIVADMALGTVEDLPHLVERHPTDHVMFCMGGLHGDRFAPLTRELNRAGVHVSLTGLGDIAPRRVGVRRVNGRPIVFIAPAVRFGWRMAVKRVVDRVIASVLLVLLAPFLALVALLIRVVDRHAAIFRQDRVGRNGDVFVIYKFQTMIAPTDTAVIDLRNDHEGPMFKMRDDPRITRLGRVLRTTSIDELPQLWNVIRGDMSLVGPRPLLLTEVAAAPEAFRYRELVMPGMTGRWQVSGRSDIDFDELDELDRWYVDNWSLSEDLEILAKTVPAVLLARGAR